MRHLAVTLFVLAVATGCSAILSFDETGRPCNENDECLPGYTCLVRKCYPNGSAAEGDTCASSALCAEEMVCAVPDFVCRAPCDNPYFADGGCAAGFLCQQRFDTEDNSVAVCTEPTCTTGGSTCDATGPLAGLSCVGIGTAGVCVEECGINCSTPPCRDNCPAVSDGPGLTCQPIGEARELGCLPEAAASTHGHSCDLGSELCADGHACVRPLAGGVGVCLRYCDPAAGSPCAGACSPHNRLAASCVPLSGTTTSVCGQVTTSPQSRGDDPALRGSSCN